MEPLELLELLELEEEGRNPRAAVLCILGVCELWCGFVSLKHLMAASLCFFGVFACFFRLEHLLAVVAAFSDFGRKSG